MNTNEKLREALGKADKALASISKSAWFLDANFAETKEVMEAGNAIVEALALPRRNCDVGTEEEQYNRFTTFCRIYSNNCNGCPFKQKSSLVDCVVQWSQMTYEEAKK